MDNKLSELKYALECLEGAQYDGEWNSALVGGGGDGAEYPAVTNLAGVVVRTARLGPHEARLCEYLEAVSPSNIRALLAELEAKDKLIAELEDDKRQLNEIVNSEANRANTAEKRITEMEFNELNLIAERDNAENVVANMYRAATGDSPEWSNWFRFANAIEEVAQIRSNLEASKKSNAFLKEQLSQLANFNPDWDMLEACRESWREVSAALKEAEKRLATPVRLGAGVLMVSAYSANSCDSEWHLCLARDSVVSAIRAAGFTVEGDE